MAAEDSSSMDGPFEKMQRTLRIVRGNAWDLVRQVIAALVLTWLPIAVFSSVSWVLIGRRDELLSNFAVEARLLVAIPLFIVADRALEISATRTLARMQALRLAGEDSARIPRLAAAVGRVRHARATELGLFALAFGSGLWVLLHQGTGVFGGSLDAVASASRFWYALVSMPLFQFLLLRVLVTWLLWAHLLFAIARLRLEPIATHPDRKGGLGMLVNPVAAFSVAITGVSAVIAAEWAQQIQRGVATTASLAPLAALFAFVSCIVALGPMVVFVGHLQRARTRALLDYTALALDHSRAFHRRWIGPRDPDALLGAPEISSLTDIGTAFDIIKETNLVPFGPRQLVIVTAASLSPMLPLALLEMPVTDVMSRLLRLFISGMPG